MLKTVFLSHTLAPDAPGFGGKSAFEVESVKAMSRGDSCNESRWHLSNHIGTHIDAPFHFSRDGHTVDQVDANSWIFTNVHLVDIEAKSGQLIEPGDWSSRIPNNCDLLLLRTGFERSRRESIYWAENPGLSANLGAWLRQERPTVRAIGIDALSATSYLHRQEGREAHKAFLDPGAGGSPVMIIEDMSLSALRVSPNEVIVAPLRVSGSDGAPVTVFARVES